uniref:Uncharacterized protein n=1 Tax=Scleropages formosus TaxID=113540 RepID=A0A8C9RCK3_SCLFO
MSLNDFSEPISLPEAFSSCIPCFSVQSIMSVSILPSAMLSTLDAVVCCSLQEQHVWGSILGHIQNQADKKYFYNHFRISCDMNPKDMVIIVV